MTQAATIPALPAEPPAETFLGIVFRRTRYVIAVLFSAWLFCSLAWHIVAPPSDWAGVSLLAWSSSSAILATVTLAALLLFAVVVSTFLVNFLLGDAPHMGLCCALLGLAGLSIRGGTSYMLIRHAQLLDTYRETSHLLALECIQWGIIFLLAEIVARAFHDRFFANTRWLTRTGVDLSRGVPHAGGTGAALGIGITVAKAIGTLKLPRPIAIPLGIIINILLGGFFLSLFLHSPEKGQVLFACFAAFFLSTHLAYYAFPRVPALALFLAVPVTAACGFWISANYPPIYPGYAGLFFSRALPIDYISAGIPGAIFGYYLAFHWDLHSRTEQSA